MKRTAIPSRLGPSTLLLAWTALIGNSVVILQGALVRATGSGAGCGRHWPSCNGTVIPLDPGVDTLIEFSHRLLSLAVLLIGLWLLLRAVRGRTDNPGLFFFASLSFVALLIEALLGGATVLLGYTGDDASVGRGIMVASHLVNSLLLIGALTATLIYARRDRPAWPLAPGRQGSLATIVVAGLLGMLLLMFSGGIAAMGNTMFPAETLAEGLAADFDPTAHPLIRLRILHPLIAVAVGTYLLLSLGLAWWLKPVVQARRPVQALLVVYVSQLLVGTVNLAFLAPLALQLLHLSLAVLAFALLVTVGVALLGHPAAQRTSAPLIDRPENA